MRSEFSNVALDCIRYSLVWEDSQTLYDALDIHSNDRLLIITSAGCNVLNTLLKNPAAVTAIDLNPVQNKLLSLKKHIILHLDFTAYQSLLGFAGKNAVHDAKENLLDTLPADEKEFWSRYFNVHPEGLLTSGKLENYITQFCGTLHKSEQQKLQQLITCKDINEQYEFFMQHLHNSSFRESFIKYFDDGNLSQGRDSRLFKFAGETGGQAFYNRLMQQIRAILVSTNFYFRFFFFGPQDMPESILPPCYRKEYYNSLKQQLSKLQIITGEAIDYLLSAPGTLINKASLSNIFEYTSRHEFEHVCQALSKNPYCHLRIVFWNLLNVQGEDFSNCQGNVKTETIRPSEQSCFYFKNVMLLHYTPVTLSNPTLLA